MSHSPLFIAYQQGNERICRLLRRKTEFNFDDNVTDYKKNSILHYVIWNNDNFGRTLLHWACNNGDWNAVLHQIINVDFDAVNSQDNDGNTPMHIACSTGNAKIVKYLMCIGARIEIVNDNKETCAAVAQNWGHSELLPYLDRQSLQLELSRT